MAALAAYAQPGMPNYTKMRRGYLNYLDVKQAEIREQQESRRYFHGKQWTRKQIEAFNKRRQPVVTYNRVGRKINALVGLLERQKQDPKGYARTPKHDDGAEVATAVLRYVCDEQHWSSTSPICGLDGAVDGLGVLEIIIEAGDMGDPEIGLERADPASFFYDPRSLKHDFSDARFMGVGKWADLEAAIEMFPDKEAELRASMETGQDLSSNPDSERNIWFASDDANCQLIRIVDYWYIENGEWRWCIYTGSMILAYGSSYLHDEKKRTMCKYIAYSANIDEEGDRYGFVRNMKSSQDEVNQRRSKGLHLLNSRRMSVKKGSGENVEQLRREAARPDGVIEYMGETPPQFDDAVRGQELQGQLAFLADAKDEIENFGFNPALIGQGVDNLSGRAMQLQQQAGIAELGPYLLAYRGWKLRVYRAIWCAVVEHWTSQRWIRVTDDDRLAQFFEVNQVTYDPITGEPKIVNALGSLDVDIIIDEGPDEITMQSDTYDTMMGMVRNGQQLPPEAVIEASPLYGSKKRKILDIIEKAKNQPPNPTAVAGAQAEVANKQASALDKQASARLKDAQAEKARADAISAWRPPQQSSGQSPLDIAKGVADIRATNAGTAKTMAETQRTQVETALKPFQH